jgi:hypothetical protein
MSAKPKATSAAILRRRRSPVAAFRRDRRSDIGVEVDGEARAIPGWGRIVFRSGVTTLR